ncbi:hypothetical protein, partial [Paenibacillus xylanexedens]|uniref:hypothetical protein n=1 Tax=Paenibacillus xylanexedens TaxID=528191 RepID=UPI0034D96591
MSPFHPSSSTFPRSPFQLLSPLTPFFNHHHYLSVLSRMRLPHPTVSTIPITLPL